jgi:hypothetical protein
MVPPEHRFTESSDQSIPPSNDPAIASGSDRPREEAAGESIGLSNPITTVMLPDLLREDIEDAPFWKEVVAFANMPQTALDPYFGKFVAVYNGDIVDSDTDEGELALRFYRTFGYVPVYIHEVGVEDSVLDIND